MSDQAVAKEIYRQIGRKSFYAIGAKNFSSTENSLSFKIGRNPGKDKGRVSHVVVTLDPSDTYTVEFIRCNARAKDPRKVLASHGGIYFDQLHTVIESETGLCTRIF